MSAAAFTFKAFSELCQKHLCPPAQQVAPADCGDGDALPKRARLAAGSRSFTQRMIALSEHSPDDPDCPRELTELLADLPSIAGSRKLLAENGGDWMINAAASNDVAAMAVLVAQGASFTCGDAARGAVPAIRAAQSGCAETTRFLIHYAASSKIVFALDSLSEHALLKAAAAGAVDVVQQLLDVGCDPKLENCHGKSTVDAAASASGSIHRGSPQQDSDAATILRLLVASGATVTPKTAAAAAYSGNLAAVQFCLQTLDEGTAARPAESSALVDSADKASATTNNFAKQRAALLNQLLAQSVGVFGIDGDVEAVAGRILQEFDAHGAIGMGDLQASQPAYDTLKALSKDQSSERKAAASDIAAPHVVAKRLALVQWLLSEGAHPAQAFEPPSSSGGSWRSFQRGNSVLENAASRRWLHPIVKVLLNGAVKNDEVFSSDSVRKALDRAVRTNCFEILRLVAVSPACRTATTRHEANNAAPAAGNSSGDTSQYIDLTCLTAAVDLSFATPEQRQSNQSRLLGFLAEIGNPDCALKQAQKDDLLHGACKAGADLLAGYLVDTVGANIHAKFAPPPKKATPLFSWCSDGDSRPFWDSLHYITSVGGRTPLHVAASSAASSGGACVAALLQRKANPNCADDRGITPLMMAMCNTGPFCHSPTDADGTPLHLLAAKELLAAGADVSARDADGNDARIYALHSTKKFVRASVEFLALVTNTHRPVEAIVKDAVAALESGNSELFSLFVNQVLTASAAPDQARELLQQVRAGSAGHTLMAIAVGRDDTAGLEMLQIMLDPSRGLGFSGHAFCRGGENGPADNRDPTLLHLAATAKGNSKAVEMLLAHGAGPSVHVRVGPSGSTPLRYAFMAQWGPRAKTCELLGQAGARLRDMELDPAAGSHGEGRVMWQQNPATFDMIRYYDENDEASQRQRLHQLLHAPPQQI